MKAFISFSCVSSITRTSDLPNGSLKNNEANVFFAGQIKQRSLEIAYSIQNCGGFE